MSPYGPPPSSDTNTFQQTEGPQCLDLVPQDPASEEKSYLLSPARCLQFSLVPLLFAGSGSFPLPFDSLPWAEPISSNIFFKSLKPLPLGLSSALLLFFGFGFLVDPPFSCYGLESTFPGLI